MKDRCETVGIYCPKCGVGMKFVIKWRGLIFTRHILYRCYRCAITYCSKHHEYNTDDKPFILIKAYKPEGKE